MAILKSKSQVKTDTLSVRLPISLLNEIEQVKQLAESRELVFDVSEIVASALSTAVKSARAELSPGR